MIQHYYTYDEVALVLRCSKSTVEKKIPQMNIQKKYFKSGKPLFLVLDVHAYTEFNKNWRECTAPEKQFLREILHNV